MKVAILVLLVAACSHGTSVRPREKLVQEVEAFAQQATRGGPPQPGDLKDVRPPSEEELHWIEDPSDHDPLQRQIVGIKLVQQCGHIGDTYLAQRDPKAIAWLLAQIDIFAEMASVSAHELKGSSDEQLSGLANEDLSQVVQMTIDTADEELRNVRKLPTGMFLQLVDGWRARVGKLRQLWTQAECDKVAGMIAIRVFGETDGATKKALQDLAAQLHDCRGLGR